MKQLIIASAHKVGSTWITNILRNYFDSKNHVVPIEYRMTENIKQIIELNATGVSEYLKSLTDTNVFKTHCTPPVESDPVWGRINVINIYRDPRDMAVSNAFYLAELSPELGGWERLKPMNVEERIVTYLENGLYDLELLEAWFANKKAIKVAFEDMLMNSYQCLDEILKQIGCRIIEKNLAAAIEKFSFQNMSGGRNPGEQRNDSFYRKGISGDWRNYFSCSVKDHFKTVHNGRWNDVLVALGYETTKRW